MEMARLQIAFRGENHGSFQDIAQFTGIAGPIVAIEQGHRLRVDAGHHELEVAEDIERPYLSIGSRQRAAGRSVKTLSIDIRPDTVYYVGAQLHPEHRTEWKDGAYWDPVVWKETPGECR